MATRKGLDALAQGAKRRPSSSVWDQTLIAGTVIVVLLGVLGIVAALSYRKSRLRKRQRNEWAQFLLASDALCGKLVPAARVYFKTVPGDPPLPAVPASVWEPLKKVPPADVVEARLVRTVGAEERSLPEGAYRYGKGEFVLAFMRGWKRKCGPEGRTVVTRARATVGDASVPVVVFKRPVADGQGRQYGLVVIIRRERFPPPPE